MFAKYVELDFDEVVCKKVMAISSKEMLRSVAEDGNSCDVDKKHGTLISPEYSLLPADLRNLEQVRSTYVCWMLALAIDLRLDSIARCNAHEGKCLNVSSAAEHTALAQT